MAIPKRWHFRITTHMRPYTAINVLEQIACMASCMTMPTRFYDFFTACIMLIRVHLYVKIIMTFCFRSLTCSSEAIPRM